MGGDFREAGEEAPTAEREAAGGASEASLVPAPNVQKKDPRLVRGEERSFWDRLQGLSPEEILPRITEGDPLGVQVVCMRRLRERALILDPDRAMERALAEVAYDASLDLPEDLHSTWIQDAVDRALSRLVSKDQAEEHDSAGAAPRDDTPYRFVQQAFGIPEAKSRRATVSFHALPLRARQAFFLLLVDGMSVQECLALGHWEPEELRMDVWEAMTALCHIRPEELEAFRTRKRRS